MNERVSNVQTETFTHIDHWSVRLKFGPVTKPVWSLDPSNPFSWCQKSSHYAAPLHELGVCCVGTQTSPNPPLAVSLHNNR
jgi:hypothetical protein